MKFTRNKRPRERMLEAECSAFPRTKANTDSEMLQSGQASLPRKRSLNKRKKNKKNKNKPKPASSGIPWAANSGSLPGRFEGLGLSPREAGWGGFREAGGWSGGEIQNCCKYSCVCLEGGALSPRLPQLHPPTLVAVGVGAGWGGGARRLSDHPWTKVISPHFVVLLLLLLFSSHWT